MIDTVENKRMIDLKDYGHYSSFNIYLVPVLFSEMPTTDRQILVSGETAASNPDYI